MIELRTLGEVALHVGGVPPAPIVDNPKRMALFTYLVVSAAAIHQRETLMAMFWPELSDTHARSALRKALHYIRHNIDDGIVLNQGDDALIVDRSAIRCDATAMELAAQRGEDDIVLKLDQGEFMKGFHLAGAPEFDYWLDAMRLHLRHVAAAATLRLARHLEARGDASAIGVIDVAASRLDVVMGDRKSAIAAYEESLRLRFRLQQQMVRESEVVAAKIKALGATD